MTNEEVRSIRLSAKAARANVVTLSEVLGRLCAGAGELDVPAIRSAAKGLVAAAEHAEEAQSLVAGAIADGIPAAVEVVPPSEPEPAASVAEEPTPEPSAPTVSEPPAGEITMEFDPEVAPE